MREQEDFDQAAVILHWNKQMMSTLGLWPNQRSNRAFFLNMAYFGLFMLLQYLDLVLFINNLEHVIMNLTETVTYSQIFVRVTMLRIHNDLLGELITEATIDFDSKQYKTIEERDAFIAYNSRSKKFVKLLMAFIALVASSYYLTPILSQLENGLPERNASGNDVRSLYVLPYRIHLFYAVENAQIYAFTYAAQMPFVFISGFGQSATDCIMVTLVFHICGQMSVLCLRIRNLSTDPNKCSKEIGNIITAHKRLLRMGKAVQEAFNVTLLVHLFGATLLICILGYQILTNFSNGEKAALLSFVAFQLGILLILYAHCAVGESLLVESERLYEAFYECKWYDMSVKNAQCILLCIVQAQKFLCLTAGKFGTFCHSTLTSVLKTSMGYLSVLRSIL